MNRFVSILALGAMTAFVFACGGNQPAVNSTSTTSTAIPSAHVVDRAAPPQSASCPAPKPTTEMCAAVMAYVKIGDACCAYGSPCEAADGKQFSDDKCTSPM